MSEPTPQETSDATPQEMAAMWAIPWSVAKDLTWQQALALVRSTPATPPVTSR